MSTEHTKQVVVTNEAHYLFDKVVKVIRETKDEIVFAFKDGENWIEDKIHPSQVEEIGAPPASVDIALLAKQEQAAKKAEAQRLADDAKLQADLEAEQADKAKKAQEAKDADAKAQAELDAEEAAQAAKEDEARAKAAIEAQTDENHGS